MSEIKSDVKIGEGIGIGDVGKLILSGASVAFFIKAAGAGAKYLAEIFYAQWLGSEQYGVYAYGLGWAQLLAVIAVLGFGNTVLRFVPKYFIEGRNALLKGIIRRSQQVVFAAGTIIFFASFLTLYLEESLLNEYGIALVVGTGCVPLLALMQVQSAIIKARKKIALALISPVVLWPVGGVVFTYILLQAWGAPGGLIALTAIAIILLLLCIFQFGAIKYVFGDQTWSVPASFDNRLWFATAFPLLIVAGFQIVLSRTDVIMTGAILGAKDVGLYNAAVRTGGLISFVLTAFNAIGAPMISEYWSAEDQDRLEQTVAFIIRWTFWSSLALVVVMFITGKFVLGLFGDEFVAAYWALMVVAAGQLVNACAGPVGYLMALTGHERVAARVYGITALINVPFNYLLIIETGLIGAAVATAVTMVIWNIWLGYEARKNVGVDIFSVWKNIVLFR